MVYNHWSWILNLRESGRLMFAKNCLGVNMATDFNCWFKSQVGMLKKLQWSSMVSVPVDANHFCGDVWVDQLDNRLHWLHRLNWLRHWLWDHWMDRHCDEGLIDRREHNEEERSGSIEHCTKSQGSYVLTTRRTSFFMAFQGPIRLFSLGVLKVQANTDTWLQTDMVMMELVGCNLWAVQHKSIQTQTGRSCFFRW